jgi:branched-chain amino acid transport system permease protein
MQPDRTLAFDRLLSGALVAGALIAATALDDSYLLRLLAVAGCYAIVTIGYQRIFGELGVLSLAQGAFFAIGGYTLAVLGQRTGLDGLILLPAATGLATLAALVVAPPMLKLASHYFALASLAVAQLVLLAAINLESVTGGSNGLSGLPPLRLAGATIEPGMPLTLTIWTAVALCAVAFWLPGGLALLRRHVLREAPLAAQALGLDPARWRIASFAFSAACAGVAGGLYVQATGVVAPDIAELAVMINVLAMSVIGGRGRVGGAIIGALILAFLPETLRFIGGWQLFAWGAAMLLMLLLAPGGIAGLLENLLPLRPATPLAYPPSVLASPAEGVLSVEGLRKSFGGVVAVDGISFTIALQEIVGVIGANGAGKTTLLNLLSGFERADAGHIRWRDGDITGQPVHERARRGIGRSFQTDQLPGDISVLDAIAAATPEIRDLERARGEAMAVIERLALTHHANRLLSDLAPATRRLVDIARALAARPSLLLLDEPTSGLNAAERLLLGQTLRGLRDDGLSLLLVEHDIGFLLSLTDRIVCLDQGRIIADGKPEDLATRADLQHFFGRRTESA